MKPLPLSRVAIAASLAIVACSVFEPPPNNATDAGADTGASGSGGSGGGASGSAGMSGASGSAGSGAAGAAGADAGVGGAAGGGGMAGSAGADAGPTGPWWPDVTADGCQSEGVPTTMDRPGASDPGSSVAPIYLAMSRMRFGSAADDDELSPDMTAWASIGFDLDTSCTASTTCEVGGTPVEEHACQNSLLVPNDGIECRDNQIGKLFPVAALSPMVGPLFGITEPDWNCALHRGTFGVIVKVSDYNGQPNDTSVRVDLYTTIGLQQLPSWTCTDGPGGTVPPQWYNQAPWLHTKRWKVAQRSISLSASDAGMDLPNAKAADQAAFVRNGYLFARFPQSSELWLDGQRAHVPGFRLLLNRSALIARINKKLDGTWELTGGTIGAVVLPGDMVQSFRELGFCENMCAAYDNVLLYLNTNQDTLSGTDEKLPTTPCDSLSIGIDFNARQAAATAADIETVDPPVDCPTPRHPLAPQHGCTCPDPGVGGPCVLSDGGADGGITDAGGGD